MLVTDRMIQNYVEMGATVFIYVFLVFLKILHVCINLTFHV